MRKNRSNPKDYDAWTALQAARAFYKHGAVFLSLIPHDLATSAQFTVQRLGDFIAAITNLMLAIELFFKCLAIGSVSRVHQTHDLLLLFNALPLELKKSIASAYAAKTAALPNVVVATNVTLVAPDQTALSDEDVAKMARSTGKNDVTVLLRNERDAFQTWRYFHEGGRRDQQMFYQVEHLYLAVLARALDAHIADGWARPEKYGKNSAVPRSTP